MGLFPAYYFLPSFFFVSLTDAISDVEIKCVFFTVAASSTPGPDGFNFHFYKKTWHVIGPSVCKVVKHFFQNGYLSPGIKAIAFVLIPKTKHASSFADFRPIALYNVIYKII
ncbi:hypothetical protein KFK09_002909 [Dendrobium nobile]|uniref:Uncharacterized protein n=1 Tax=Dendrobium nobile TaxID=94219 RepID=A0A8T3C7M7_DENNO|nr:hypothetical protein KFK09_002909 [Dendrobium nobile]